MHVAFVAPAARIALHRTRSMRWCNPVHASKLLPVNELQVISRPVGDLDRFLL